MLKSIVTKNDSVGISRDPQTGHEIDIKGSAYVKNAIKKISGLGKITFSREQYFKSTYYTFHFFKPVPGLRNLYNLGNEILILCCNDSMRDFKSRTKDFLDYVLTTRGEFKNRLDKITCIVIDNNREIEKIVSEDRQENTNTRLIVPFCYEEFDEEFDEHFFQNRMRNFLFERDLYGIASPLNDDVLFFGKDRSDLISELCGKYKQGEQSGLFGLRRIGKTSVLNLLKQRIEQDGGAAVYFDCSLYHHQRWNQFLGQIIIEVTKEYMNRSDEDDEPHLPSGFQTSMDKLRYSEEVATQSFEEDIISIFNALGQVRILLIFDEIENISYTTSPSNHWKTENDALFFWQTLRGIIQKNNRYFSYLIAGVNPKCIEDSRINQHDNPIFGALHPSYITLFDYSDVKKMVSVIGGHIGLSFDEEVFAKLVDDYGGHPFLTRQVCSKINKGLLEKKEPRPYKVTKYNYEKHSKDYQLEMSGIIEQILVVLESYYPKEYELLKKLSLNGRSSFSKEIRLGGEKAILHLLGYCLIKKDEEDYYIRIKSIDNYLKNKYANDAELKTQEEKRFRINMRRDKLEGELRNIIFYTLQHKYGSKAKDKLIEYLDGTTKDSTQARKMRDVKLKGAMEELYFWQLKEIILKDWKDYQNIFNDKVKFENFFDLINKSRSQGDHSHALDDEDEALYNVAFKYFEKAFECNK